ncbi:MAG: iron ABC transporter permease [Candidatus Devosia phytovorans]|uniref:Iron ABC transporter permease n=1 Tax=Candidatus Devosia phytovorans TaxID=3121372 RepID=A0AAJ5VRN6_9HYPH|nr:iron ABC transporter permease [Devosia sp.]WEK02890.1 MAG: iron ABC transporter permease [Devosia sp.]
MTRTLLLATIPAAVVVGLGVLHLRLGAAPMEFTLIRDAFLAYDSTNYSHVIVIFQRLTRLAVAVYAGAALGAAGYLLQKIMQNGLVSPSTLGISAGATNFVVLSVFFFGMSGVAQFIPALAGGVTAILLTLGVSHILKGQGDPRLNLVLAGSMVATLFSAITTFVVSLDADGFANLIGWLIGNIGNFDYVALAPMAPIGALAMIAAVIASRAVDILVLGEEQAAAMGVNVTLVYGGTLLTAVVLAVTAVTVVGPIGFVGLVVPHMVRSIAGEIGRLSLWLSMVGGAVVLTSADILARTAIAPRVMNVGTVMGFTGGLVFLGLVLWSARRRRSIA